MKPPALLAAGMFATIVLGGCVRYQARPISAEATASEFGARSLSSPGLKSFVESSLPDPPESWPPARWDMTKLTLAAFYYHPSLDLARAEWASANARVITAGQRANPTLNVTPGYNTTRSIPSPWLPFAGLEIPLETAGKRGHRIARAQELSEAARLNIASVAWQVRSGVRNTLSTLDAAEEARKLLEEQQTLQADNVRLLERQHEAGAISAFELTQARIAADASLFALHEAERQSAEARVQLADAVGVPAAALEEAPLSFEDLDREPEEASLAGARQQALSNRSDILGALAEYAASQSALQLEVARQYPDIHLLPGYQYDQGEDKWTLGLTVTLPLMNRNKGGIAEASAAREEAAARFNLLQAKVVAAIDTAVAGYQVARTTRTDAEASLARLQEQESRASAMFDIGEISRSDLLALRLQIGAAALARLDAVVKVRQAIGRLEEALQSPLGLPAAAWQLPPRPPGGGDPGVTP
jgi:outer membrane protein, heavy metal efflux system